MAPLLQSSSETEKIFAEGSFTFALHLSVRASEVSHTRRPRGGEQKER